MMKRQMISFVQMNMKRSWLPFALLTLTLIACGGAGTGTGTGAVAGLVLDANGDPVRGAKVFFDGERLLEKPRLTVQVPLLLRKSQLLIFALKPLSLMARLRITVRMLFEFLTTSK